MPKKTNKTKKISPAKEWRKPPSVDEPGGDSAAGVVAFEDIDAYYESESSCFFTRDSEGVYRKTTSASMGRQLRLMGFPSRAAEGETASAKDRALHFIEHHRVVDWAGPLAGWKIGFQIIEGFRILVTQEAKLIEPRRGKWDCLRTIIDGLFGEEQKLYFIGWLKLAVENLRHGRRRRAPAMVLAGPPACGKSLCLKIITACLGGRSGNPYAHLTGNTPFNSELLGSEHLIIDDEAAAIHPAVRKTFGQEIKKLCMANEQRCHPKGGKALTLWPVWRLSLALNDDSSALAVLPPCEDGLMDKLMLMRVRRFKMPVDTGAPSGEEMLWSTILSELPSFIDYMLHDFEITPEMTDPNQSRSGIRCYHNPELLDLMDTVSNHQKMLELIDGLPLWATFSEEVWEGKASEIEELLIDRYHSIARNLFGGYSGACGSMLGMLRKEVPGRINRRKLHGYNIWQITPPPREELID